MHRMPPIRKHQEDDDEEEEEFYEAEEHLGAGEASAGRTSMTGAVRSPDANTANTKDNTLVIKNLDKNGAQVSLEEVESELRRASLQGKGGLDSLSNYLSPQINDAYGSTDRLSAHSAGTDDGHSLKPSGSLSKLRRLFKRRPSRSGESVARDGSSSPRSASTSDLSITTKQRRASETYLKVKSKGASKNQFSRVIVVQELGSIIKSSKASISQTQTAFNMEPRFPGNAQANILAPPESPSLVSDSSSVVEDSGPVQHLTPEVTGAVWSLRFSPDGKYLAAGGQDTLIRVWIVLGAPQDERVGARRAQQPTRTDSYLQSSDASSFFAGSETSVFRFPPLRVYRGHTADILDLSWSRNNFLISSSMDKTVRLWHVTRRECLCVFQHQDFVTSVRFHPADDRLFVSGSLDGKLRLWSTQEKRVKSWYELPQKQYVTSVSFTSDATYVLAGTYAGDAIILETEGLKYYTMVHATNRSFACKITSMECPPPSMHDPHKILITSNDSRIRLYDLRDKGVFRKYKGHVNKNMQLRASFSDDGHYIICPSEDKSVYIWPTTDPTQTGEHAVSASGILAHGALWLKEATLRGSLGNEYTKIEVSDDVVTAAVFAPRSTTAFLESAKLRRSRPSSETKNSPSDGRIIVVADYKGRIRVLESLDSNSGLGNSGSNLPQSSSFSTLDLLFNKGLRAMSRTNSVQNLPNMDGSERRDAASRQSQIDHVSERMHLRETSMASNRSAKGFPVLRMTASSSSLNLDPVLASPALTSNSPTRRTLHVKDSSTASTNSMREPRMQSFLPADKQRKPANPESEEEWACSACNSRAFALLKGGRVRCLACNAIGEL